MGTKVEYCITEYGACGDGSCLDTAALQQAIDDCSSAGGGIVTLPAGEYRCGTVELKSNITLMLSQGAVLKASERMEDYRPIGFHHNEMGETVSFLYALHASHIRITGDGEIHLGDQAFIDFDQLHPFEFEPDALSEQQWQEATAMYRDRPNQPIFFHDCKHITVDHIKLRHSPYWTLTFSCCEYIDLHHLVIDNHLRVPNSDGVHLCGSKNVRITDCTITSGDDCIAITGITNWDAVAESILIANCILTSHSSAIRLGHLTSKVRDVIIHHVIIRQTNRGIGIFAGEDGFVERVAVSHVMIQTQIKAGAWWGQGEPLVISAADKTGKIRNVSVSSVQASAENGVWVIGTEGNIHNVQLTDWQLTLSEGANRPLYGQTIDLAPFPSRPVPKGMPWLVVEEAASVTLRNIRYQGNDAKFDSGCVIDVCDVKQTST